MWQLILLIFMGCLVPLAYYLDKRRQEHPISSEDTKDINDIYGD